MPNINEIGERITKLREAHGLSQQELSVALNVAREVVAKWETGTRDLKTEYTIKLADFFNVTCDYILRGIKAENVDINKRLGLSDEAIAKLEQESEERKLYCDLTLGFDIVDHMIKTGLIHKLSHDIAFSMTALYALPIRLKLKETERADLEKVKHNSDDDFNRYTNLGVEINQIKETIDFTKWKITKTIDDMVFDTIDNDLLPFYRDKSEERAKKEAENKNNQDETL